MRRPKILNLRSNQGSVTQTKFTNSSTPIQPPAKARPRPWGLWLPAQPPPSKHLRPSAQGPTQGLHRPPWHGCSRGAFTGTRRRHWVDLSLGRRADQISKVLDILGTRHMQHTHSAKPHIPTHITTQNNNLYLLYRPVGLPPNCADPTSYRRVPPLTTSPQGLRP